MIFIFLLCLAIKFIIDYKLFSSKLDKKFFGYNFLQIIGGTILLIIFLKLPNRIPLSNLDSFFVFLSYFVLTLLIYNFKSIVKFKNKNYANKFILVVMISLVISGIFELTICNFKFFKSLNYKPLIYTKNDLRKVEDKNYYEINNINTLIKNIYIDVITPNNYYLNIMATDEGNAFYYSLPTREISNNIETSKYINLNLNGKSQKIALNFYDKDVNIKQVILNQKVPLFFNSGRYLLVCLILITIFLFKSNSIFFKRKLLDLSYPKHLVVLLVMFQVFSFTIMLNRGISTYYDTNNDYYNQLTESIKNKKVTIEDKQHTEEILNKISNPYDSNLRSKEFDKTDKMFLWDAAFYKGHYYVYFGIVPVILFYLPFNLIFGVQLSTIYLIYFCTIITAFLITLLLYQIVKHKYKKCSVGIFILLDLLLVYCTGLEYLVKIPEIYSVPIVCGLMFTFLGLNLYLSSLHSRKLVKTKMTLGSLSLALVAGCRPQLLLGSLLIIPILISFYHKNKKAVAKKDYWKYVLAIIIPYIIVALLLMYYNYIRFKSPFDFGANYNLTTNDMTKRGFKFGRIPLGLFVSLFNPLPFKNVFPFIAESTLVTNYMGITIYEPVYGGLLTTTLIYLIVLFLPKFKKIINSKLIYNTCLLLLAIGLGILIVDIQLAGILARYLSDFSWTFGFITAFILLAIENKDFKYKNYFYKIVTILIFGALIYQFFYYFCSSYNFVKNGAYSVWLYFYYLIQFWL